MENTTSLIDTETTYVPIYPKRFHKKSLLMTTKTGTHGRTLEVGRIVYQDEGFSSKR